MLSGAVYGLLARVVVFLLLFRFASPVLFYCFPNALQSCIYVCMSAPCCPVCDRPLCACSLMLAVLLSSVRRSFRVIRTTSHTLKAVFFCVRRAVFSMVRGEGVIGHPPRLSHSSRNAAAAAALPFVRLSMFTGRVSSFLLYLSQKHAS